MEKEIKLNKEFHILDILTFIEQNWLKQKNMFEKWGNLNTINIHEEEHEYKKNIFLDNKEKLKLFGIDFENNVIKKIVNNEFEKIEKNYKNSISETYSSQGGYGFQFEFPLFEILTNPINNLFFKNKLNISNEYLGFILSIYLYVYINLIDFLKKINSQIKLFISEIKDPKYKVNKNFKLHITNNHLWTIENKIKNAFEDWKNNNKIIMDLSIDNSNQDISTPNLFEISSLNITDLISKMNIISKELNELKNGTNENQKEINALKQEFAAFIKQFQEEIETEIQKDTPNKVYNLLKRSTKYIGHNFLLPISIAFTTALLINK